MPRSRALRVMGIATMNPYRRRSELGQRIFSRSRANIRRRLDLRKLARKVMEEHDDKPEAWKLHICLNNG